MVDYKLILSGNALFLTGILGMILMGYLMPGIFTNLNDSFNNIPDQTVTTLTGDTAIITQNVEQNATFEAIGWIGVIIIWVLITLVMPLALIVYGLTGQIIPTKNNTATQEPLTILEVVKAVLWGLFTILIFYLGRFWITSFADVINTIQTDHTLILIIFWMTVIVAVFVNVIVIPIYIIIQYRGTE